VQLQIPASPVDRESKLLPLDQESIRGAAANFAIFAAEARSADSALGSLAKLL